MRQKAHKIEKVEIIDDRTAIRIHFENGQVYEIPWDYILYHFEPEYQCLDEKDVITITQ